MLSKFVGSARASLSVRVVNSARVFVPRSRPLIRGISITRPLREAEKLDSDEGFSNLLKGISAPPLRPEVIDVIRLADFPRAQEPRSSRGFRPRSKQNFSDRRSEIPHHKRDLQRSNKPDSDADSDISHNKAKFDTNNPNVYRYQAEPRVSAEKLKEGQDPATIRLASIIRNYGIKLNLPDAINTYEEAKIEHPERLTVYTISSLISACVRCKDMVAADRFLAEMKEMGIAPNVVTYNTLIAGYSRIKNFNKALATFQTLKDSGLEPDEITYSYILAVYAELKDPAKISALEKEIAQLKSTQPSQEFKNRLIRAAALGRVDEAFAAVNDLRKANLPLDWFVYKHVFKTCATAGDYSRVSEVYEEAIQVPGLRLGTYESNAAIQGYIHKGDIDAAEKIYNDMSFVGNYRNVYTFNTMISAWTRRGRPEKAIECVIQMEKEGIKFDDVSYTILVQGLTKSKNFAHVEELFQEFSKSDITPSSLLFATTINAFVDSNDVERAEKFFNLGMTFPVVRTFPESYNAIMKHWSRKRNISKLNELFELMLKNGATPDSSTYATVITGAYDNSMEAMKYFNDIKARGIEISPPVYSTVMTVLARAKDMANLLPIIESQMDSSHQFITNAIVSALSTVELHDRLLAYFEKITKRGVKVDAYILSRLTQALIVKGRTAELFNMMDSVRDLNFAFFRNVAIHLSRAQDWPSIIRLVESYMKKSGIEPVEAVAAYYGTAQKCLREDSSKSQQSINARTASA